MSGGIGSGSSGMTDTRGHAARYAGYMLTAAAVLVAGLDAATPPTGLSRLALAICTISLMFGMLLMWLGVRVPRPLLYAAPLVAVVLTCTQMVSTRAGNAAGAIILVWPVLFSAYLLPKAIARTTLVAAIGYFGLVAIITGDFHAVMLWVEAAVSLTLTHYVSLRLRARVDQLVASLHDQAHTDALTNLANRRSFSSALDREMLRHNRTRAPLAIMLLDVDYFKQINDISGHNAGDAALRRLADLMLRLVRGNDFCARVGGEEFAILLPDTTLAGATAMADRICTAIDTAASTWPDPVTVSIGVAAVPDNATDIDWLLREADRALYAAKSSGRNTIRAAT